MGISRELKINITGKTATFDKPLYLFQGDKNIDLYIEILDRDYIYENQIPPVSTSYMRQPVNVPTGRNIIRSLRTGTFAKARILKPNMEQVIIGDMPIRDNKVLLTIAEELIDDLSEIGEHELQIVLQDTHSSRTLPKVKFEVIEPVFIDKDAVVGKSLVGSCNVVSEEKIGRAKNGRYIRTNWVTGDFITASKLNNIEDELIRLEEEKYVHPNSHPASMISEDETHRWSTDAEKTKWDNKSDFSGDYDDLTNKPTIPVVDVTKNYVDSELAKKSPTGHNHNSDYASKSSEHTHTNKSVVDGITSDNINNYNTAYNHSQEAHAPANAEQNVQSDWNVTDTNSDAFIKNKPTIPSIEGLASEEYVENMVSKGKVIEKSVEGSYLTINDSVSGSIKDIEIHGNTVQGSDLSNIQSVGIIQQDGKVKLSILSCGKNIIKKDLLNPVPSSTYGYIKLPSDSNYYLSIAEIDPSIDLRSIYFGVTVSGYDSTGGISWCVSNGELVSSAISSNSGKFKYVSFHPNTQETIDLLFKRYNIQLEKSSKVTSYEPYQESRCDILLPCQLEGLESGRDRLYYDKDEKAWCIEDNTVDISLNGCTVFSNVDIVSPNTARVGIRVVGDLLKLVYADTANLICDRFNAVRNYTQDIEGVFQGQNSKDNLYFRINKSELNNDFSSTNVIKYLQSNVKILKGVAEIPKKIILPLDTQIALNSLANQTNVWIDSGEVSGIFKGKVSKSLASSLQSAHDTLEKHDERLKNIEGLQESQNFKYATDKGYQVCEQTKNGQIDKLKLSGKTLNNMMSMEGTWTFNSTDIIAYFTPNDKEKISTLIRNYNKVTMIFLNLPSSAVSCMLYNYSGLTKKNSINVFDLDSTLSGNIIPHIYALSSNPFNQDEVKKIKIMIIPGDQLDIAPYLDYFEGLASVGDGADKLEVLSCNENLFTKQFISEFETTHKFDSDDNMTLSGKWCSKFDLSHIKRDTIYISYKWEKLTSYTGEPYVAVYDKYANRILPVKDGTYEKYTSTNGFGAINFYISSGNLGECKYSNIMISSKKREYTPRKLHKKQILFKDNDETWKKPILRGTDTVQDSIEQLSDGRCIYAKNWDTTTIDNTFTIETANASIQVDGYFTAKITIPNMVKNLGVDSILCGDFKTNIGKTESCEGIYNKDSFSGYNVIALRVLNSKAATLETLRTWLTTNNIPVVFKLETPMVYECTPIALNSYADETMISFVGGAIKPHLEFEITSHVNNMILGNTKRINYLEDKMSGILQEISSIKSSEDVSIVDNILTLTKDKNQITTLVNNTEIRLPSVTSYTEIHLFFTTTSNLTLVLPIGVKWQTTPSILANKTYELIFTYTDRWLGGIVEYT